LKVAAKAFPSEVKPTAARVADWVEYRALEQRVAFKRGDLRAALSIDDVADREALEVRVWETLQNRSRLFKSNWPLQLNGSRLTRRRPSPVDLTLYRYLLLLGMGEIDAQDRQLFELLVADVIAAITGVPGLRTGAPATAATNPSFRKRVDDYATRSGLVPKYEYVAEPLPSDQDFGLDVVTWYPFEDGRSGYFHVVVQCATGDDWSDKLDELHIPAWSQHINWAVPPLRVFSVPVAVTMTPVRWVRMCRKSGVMLDRPRLMELNRRKPLGMQLAREVRGRVRALAVS
jgi:hypothetical protein